MRGLISRLTALCALAALVISPAIAGGGSRYIVRSAWAGGQPAGTTPPIVTPAVALPKLAAALTAVRANTADAIWISQGDSTNAGIAYGDPAGAPTGDLGVNARPRAIPAQIAARLKTLLGPTKVTTDAFFGLQGFTSIANYTAYNAQVAIGPGWAIGSTDTLGGRMLQKASATAGPISFTTTDPATSFEVYIADASAGATATFTVDGGSATTFTTSGGNLVRTVNVPAGSAGVHTLAIDTGSATQLTVMGVIARHSGIRRLVVINAGVRSTTSTALLAADRPWRATQMSASLAPALFEESVGINDIRTGGANLTKAQQKANVQALVGYAATADIILRTPSEISPTDDQGSGGHMSDVQAAYAELASSLGVPLIDTPATIGTYATLFAAGKYQDGLHMRDPTIAATLGAAIADAAYAGAVTGGYVP